MTKEKSCKLFGLQTCNGQKSFQQHSLINLPDPEEVLTCYYTSSFTCLWSIKILLHILTSVTWRSLYGPLSNRKHFFILGNSSNAWWKHHMEKNSLFSIVLHSRPSRAQCLEFCKLNLLVLWKALRTCTRGIVLFQWRVWAICRSLEQPSLSNVTGE